MENQCSLVKIQFPLAKKIEMYKIGTQGYVYSKIKYKILLKMCLYNLRVKSVMLLPFIVGIPR